jgi:ABC-type polysaccharide/polyol phosphate export permease
MALAESACAVMVSVWVRDTAFASLIVAVFFIPSTALGGYTWPRISMPHIYKLLSYLMPFAHYGDSLRSLYLKGIPLSVLVPEFKWFGWFTAATCAIAGCGVLVRTVFAKEDKANGIY